MIINLLLVPFREYFVSGIDSGNSLISQNNIAALFGHVDINDPGDDDVFEDLEAEGRAESQLYYDALVEDDEEIPDFGMDAEGMAVLLGITNASLDDIPSDENVEYPHSASYNSYLNGFASAAIYEGRMQHFFNWRSKANLTHEPLQDAIISYFDTWYATGSYAPTTLRGWFSALKTYFDLHITEFGLGGIADYVIRYSICTYSQVRYIYFEFLI